MATGYSCFRCGSPSGFPVQDPNGSIQIVCQQCWTGQNAGALVLAPSTQQQQQQQQHTFQHQCPIPSGLPHTPGYPQYPASATAMPPYGHPSGYTATAPAGNVPGSSIYATPSGMAYPLSAAYGQPSSSYFGGSSADAPGAPNFTQGPSPGSSRDLAKTVVASDALRDAAERRREVPQTLSCPECSAMFTKRHNLESHLRSHYGEKPFLCRYCSRPFGRKSDCDRHEKGVCKERPADA